MRNKNWKHGKHCPNRIHTSNKNNGDQKENRESSKNLSAKPCNIDQKRLQEQKEKMEKWIRDNASNKPNGIEKVNTNKMATRKGSGLAQHTISKIGRTYVKGNASILYNMALKRGNVGSDTSDSDSDKPPLKMTKPRHKRLDRIALHNSAKFTRKIQSASDPEVKDAGQEKNPVVYVGKYNRAVQRQNVLPKIGYNFSNTMEGKTSQKLSDILEVLDKNGGPKVRITAENIDEMFDGYASTDSESSEASTLCESDSEPESVIQKEDRKPAPQNQEKWDCDQKEEHKNNRKRLPSICLESDSDVRVLFEGQEPNTNRDNFSAFPQNRDTTMEETGMMDESSGSEIKHNTDLDDKRISSNKDHDKILSSNPDPINTNISQNEYYSGCCKTDRKELGPGDEFSKADSMPLAENADHNDDRSHNDHQSLQKQESLEKKQWPNVDCKKSMVGPEGALQNTKQDQDCTFVVRDNGKRTSEWDLDLYHKSKADFSMEGEVSNGLNVGSPATVEGVHTMMQDISHSVKNDSLEDSAQRTQQSPGSCVCKRAIDCEHKSDSDCDESHKIKADMNSKHGNHKVNEPNISGAFEYEIDKLDHHCSHCLKQHQYPSDQIKATGKLGDYNDAIKSRVDMDMKIMQSAVSEYTVDKTGSLGCNPVNECVGNCNSHTGPGVIDSATTTHAFTEHQHACMVNGDTSPRTHTYCMSDVKSDYGDFQSIGNQYPGYIPQHGNDHKGDSHSITGNKVSGENACLGKHFPTTASLQPETHSSESNMAIHKSTAVMLECCHKSTVICDGGLLHDDGNSFENKAVIVEDPAVCQKAREVIKLGNCAENINKREENMEENIEGDESVSGIENSSNKRIMKCITIDNDRLEAEASVEGDRFHGEKLKGCYGNSEYVDLGEDVTNSSQSDLCHNGGQFGATQTQAFDGRDNGSVGVMTQAKVITNSDTVKLERVVAGDSGAVVENMMMNGTSTDGAQWNGRNCEANGGPSKVLEHDLNSGGNQTEIHHAVEGEVDLCVDSGNSKQIGLGLESSKISGKSDYVPCDSFQKGQVGLEGALNASVVVPTKAKPDSDGPHSTHNTIANKIDGPNGSALCASTAITCDPDLMAGPVDGYNMTKYMKPASGFHSFDLGPDPKSCPTATLPNDTKCSSLNRLDVQLIPGDNLKDKMDVQIDGSHAADEPLPSPGTADGTNVTTGGVIEGQMACHQSTGNEAQEVLVPASSLDDKCSTQSATVCTRDPEGRLCCFSFACYRFSFPFISFIHLFCDYCNGSRSTAFSHES